MIKGTAKKFDAEAVKKSSELTEPEITFPAANQRPCWAIYEEPFTAQSRHCKAGVYHCTAEEVKGEDGQKTPQLINTWICSPLRVIAITQTDTGKEHLLEFVPHGTAEPVRIVSRNNARERQCLDLINATEFNHAFQTLLGWIQTYRFP